MGAFWNFIKYELDYKMLILDVITLGIYGSLVRHEQFRFKVNE
jgi:hypothetical protein